MPLISNEELPKLNVILKHLSRETTVPPPRTSSNISCSRQRRPPLIYRLPSLAAPLSPSENGGPGHAGSAFTGGARVAYDPHDLLEASEDARAEGKLPRLTLVEEVLLLGIKDKQGYLSLNDNIYVLRGCILIELAMRRRIEVVWYPRRKRLPLPDRPITVLSTRQMGETLLDEMLQMMKQREDAGEKMGVGPSADLLSGETWNVLKIGFQLKQVREGLAKGVLPTEKRNFLLFDMATHPVVRIFALLPSTTSH
ncbi:Golgi phosphoprotein 3-domain-containing protein [Mycena albidolilacea]|uniref:Golgi phosphoprotein 3-domain-containing protein n=1 Tax=Mycena albidolilacea TaxID=1033008 RepID=A0AAD6ZTP6_9AGAR|nr:Golgi phosphoprotein 3-domain-containing protein [Mycena albidolilacea]